jgi:hypothetical protein
MIDANAAQASGLQSGEKRTGRLRQVERRQIAVITIAAIAVFVTLRWLPTGTNLNHMDFRVDAKNSIDFCDPLNPQFIPVVAVASPVALTLSGADQAQAGREVRATLTLKTATGKPIGPSDLIVSHTKRLHLLIADPTLTDYQHVHPEPTKTPGEWTFAFLPRFGGVYRVFADFTPAATARSLYANSDLPVSGAAAPISERPRNSWISERDGYRFALAPASQPIRARQVADLTFAITRADGRRVPMEVVMGAFAHLVAFDEARSGFAHLHPMEIELTPPPDAFKPILHFKITIPRNGRYVIWAQLNLAGHETFVPFWFDVAE